MGQQKPSELLAETEPACPPGGENLVFFNCLLLRKLLKNFAFYLLEADMADKQFLSGSTYQIWTHHVHLHHDTVAAVTRPNCGNRREPPSCPMSAWQP
jgi:hypothetical protein